MSQEKNVADAESQFLVVSVTPDFCQVAGQVLPYDIVAYLPPEKAVYAHSVLAHSEYVLTVDSVVAGVVGNLGMGVQSQVSLAGGNSQIVSGAGTVFVEGRKLARHDDLVEMNGNVLG